MDVKAWLSQPTTIKGIGAIAGVLAGAVAHLVARDQTMDAAVAGAVYGIIHVILPEKPAVADSGSKFAQDALQAAIAGKLASALPELFGDAVVLETAIQKASQGAATVPNIPAQTGEQLMKTMQGAVK